MHNEVKNMKKRLFILPLTIVASFAISACSSLNFNRYINIVVTDVSNPTAPEEEWVYEEVYKTKANIFNSAIMPMNPKESWPTDKTFLGYGVKDFEKGVSRRKDFYRSKGLVRYNDIKKYAKKNTVTLKAAYCNPEDVPYQLIVVGWYARTKTSGLDEEKMSGFEKMLKAQLKSLKDQLDKGEITEQELGFTISDKDLAEIEVRSYDGDVATIGGNITFDDDVDIFLGAGVNLGSQGGVEYIKQNAYQIAGVADRYIYRLNDRPQAKNVYTWMRSAEVKAYFK